jgi:hypothetical protein
VIRSVLEAQKHNQITTSCKVFIEINPELMSKLHRLQARLEGSNKSVGMVFEPSKNSHFILPPKAVTKITPKNGNWQVTRTVEGPSLEWTKHWQEYH